MSYLLPGTLSAGGSEYESRLCQKTVIDTVDSFCKKLNMNIFSQLEYNVLHIEKQLLIARDKKNEASLQKCLRMTISRSSPKSYDVCSVYLALREVQWRSHDMIRHPTPRTHQGPSKKGTTAGVIIGPLTKTTMASATWREFAKMIRLCAGVLRDIIGSTDFCSLQVYW